MAASKLKRSGAGDPNYMKDMIARGKAQSEMKKFQEQISPKGVAAADAAAKKALEEKYPGMFIPQTRTTPGLKKDKKK
ncbi:hypothetical protein EB001_22210 [bacterium]|nr:hypothetical protein [bacterium]